MTTVFPLRNLGPDAEPWGRTVQGAVSGLERDLAQAINSNNATDQMQTTQLNSLVQSQKILQAQQGQLQNGIQVIPWDWYLEGSGSITPENTETHTVFVDAPEWATSVFGTITVSVYGEVFPDFTMLNSEPARAMGGIYTTVDYYPVCYARGTSVPVSNTLYADGAGSAAGRIDILSPNEKLMIDFSAYTPAMSAGTSVTFRLFATIFWRAD